MKTSVLTPCLLTGLAIMAGAFTLQAADLTWDADPITTSGAQDGAGNWTSLASNTNWWDGAANVTWNNATPDNAIFGVGGTAATVTVPSNTTNTVGNLTFNALASGGYNIAAGSSTTSKLNLSGTPTITVTNGVFATNNVVTSGTGFVKDGSGTLVLGGTAANIYTGTTMVTNGALVLSKSDNIVAISGDLIVASGATVTSLKKLQLAPTANLTVNGTFDTSGKMLAVNSMIVDNNAQILGSSSSVFITNATVFDVRSGTINPNLAGPAGMTKTTDGTVVLTASGANIFTGPTLISAGILDLNHGGIAQGLPSTMVTITNTGMLRLLHDTEINTNATVIVAGGTFELFAHNDTVSTLVLDNSGQILNGGNNSKTLTVLTNMDFRSGLCASKLGGAGAMVKSTAGTVTLTMDNANSGGTLISGGILQLGDGSSTNRGQFGTGPVTNNAVIVLNHSGAFTLANSISGSGSLTNLGGSPSLTADNSYSGGTAVIGGTLFAKNTTGSATGSGAVNVTNATLAGNGIISGPVTIQSSGALEPGNSAIGTLTINNTLTLGGTFTAEVNTGAIPNTDQVAGTSAVNYGGTLQIVNVGPALTASDTFQIFPAGTRLGTFVMSPVTPDNNAGLAWNTSTLTADGTLRISSVGGGPDTTPTNLVSSVSSGNLTLTWPSTHTGWTLQTQTNSRSIGLVPATNAWFDVSGSTTTNQVIITVDPVQPTVFYRLMLAIP